MNLSKINKYSIILIVLSLLYILFSMLKSKNEDLVIDTPLGAISIGPIVDLTPEEEEQKLIDEFDKKEKALNRKRDSEKNISDLKVSRSERDYNANAKKEEKRVEDEKKGRNVKLVASESQRNKEALKFDSENRKVKQLKDLKEELKKNKSNHKSKSDHLKKQDKVKLDAALQKKISTQKAYVARQKSTINGTFSSATIVANRTLKNVSKSLKNPLGASYPDQNDGDLGGIFDKIKAAAVKAAAVVTPASKTTTSTQGGIFSNIQKVIAKARTNQATLDKINDTNPAKMTDAQKKAARKLVEDERKKTDALANLNLSNRQTVIDNNDEYMEDLKAIETRRDGELKVVFTKLIAKYNQDVARIENS